MSQECDTNIITYHVNFKKNSRKIFFSTRTLEGGVLTCMRRGGICLHGKRGGRCRVKLLAELMILFIYVVCALWYWYVVADLLYWSVALRLLLPVLLMLCDMCWRGKWIR